MLVPVDGFDSPAGKGASGRIGGKSIAIGNSGYFASIGVATASLEAESERLRRDGATVVNIAVDGRLAGLFAIADPVKPSHELLGEVLLQAGKAKEAAEAFDACLLLMPNRARSLMGAAKAYAAAGNKEKAAERFATLNSFWKGKPISNPTTDAR